MKTSVKKVFRLGELFCGPGGLAYGATTARIDDSEYKIVHKWANDYDADTCKTYIRNICPNEAESVICGDVRKAGEPRSMCAGIGIDWGLVINLFRP